jgi:thiol-disulfide isomerase/thioredoxin
MKEVFRNLFLFIGFSVTLSAYFGCGGSENVNNSAVPAPSESPSVTQAKPSSDYPPIATSVDKAEITNLDGSTFKLEDRRGKVVLVNLWATWCGPCRSEMPHLVKMQDAYRSRDFEVIGINVDDEPKDKIDSFAAEMKLNYTLVWTRGALQNDLLKISKFPGIPQSFLIDRNGHLRGVFRGGGPDAVREMEETVEKTVNENT